MNFDQDYCIEVFRRLLEKDSTTGQYEEVQALLITILEELGFPYTVTRKGGVIADRRRGRCAGRYSASG